MTAPKSNDEDDPSGPQTQTQTPSSSPEKKHTPSASTGSAPVRKATTPGKDGTTRATPGAQRPRSATTRSHPTLLSDFLLGRPSPARVAADRQAAREAAQARRLSLEMVKQEMRQAAVMRVQAPGGVHDRVKKWQKANLAAMASADPFATPSEPSEMNIQVDDESVTEEDRMRIKARQKKPAPKIITGRKTEGGDSSKGSQEDLKLSNPPKKRVVSDTNWMKNKKKGPSRSRSPKAKANENNGSPLPKDFLARTAANPSVSKKVKDWASKVEVPSEVSSNRHSIPGRPKSSCSGDGIRVRPIPSENDNASGRSSARITVKSNDLKKTKEPEGDGIRVKPIPSEKDTASEMTESSRVTSEPSKPQTSKAYEDDGIRIRPGPSDNSTTSGTSDSTRTVEVPLPLKQKSQEGSTLKPQATRKQAQHHENFKNKSRQASTSKYQARVSSHTQESDGATTVRASSRQSSRRPSTRGTSTHRDPSPSDMEVVEDLKPEGLRIPTRTSSNMPLKKEKEVERPISKGYEDTATVMTEEVSDSESWSSDSVSDMPFSDLQQTLADIPVGYSAFSELDLASGSKRRKARPKTKRQPSFKGATNVLKKALTEGKKILTEKVEHPKPVVNQPPNIETWLKATLDPFVDSSSIPEPDHNRNPEDEWIDESKTRHSTPSKPKPKPAHVTSPSDFSKSEGTVESRETEKPEPEEPNRAESTTPTPAGLKRSRATRLSSTPSKSSSKKGLKEKFIDAFRGESTGHSPPPLEYPSCPEVVDLDEEREHEHRERHRSSGARRSSSPDDYNSSESSELTQTAPSPISSKRKPPTNGFHELSTIVSEESRSTFPSELSSVVSQSTITESTNLTRSSALSRKRSQKPPGLKRRLTKHSDLISVLSLPDDASGPPRTRSRRSARCVRRPSTRLGSATIDELLLEFEDDEDLYLRELKTLVDGVIPVLLTQFVNKNSRARKDLFGSPPQKYKEDTLDNAVVNMGIALDSLRNHHRLCPPLNDTHRLIGWLESVHSIYNNYLDVWRLGFQGIIVNLAPKSFDDADSLINAMPRNEQGDVLNEDGDRIDVAHLLKRPLVRIKWITKFIKGYQSITGTRGLDALVSKWEVLQEKAKRRHKEENARVVDEDAKNSDTSRTRDLRTLEALENVKVDRFRQVYAKDTFDLDLRHSNGQRLECQVELIIRDNQVFKSDPGDLLIRETGNSGRSWLLFAPVLGGRFSARTGDHKHQLVVMIRGSRDEWFELLSLTTDNEEQIVDWLNMLGHAPIPPAIQEPTSSISQPMVPSPKSAAHEIPLGESKLGRKLVLSRTSTKPVENLGEPTTPAFSRNQSPPTTPTSTHQTEASTPSPEKTPTQDSYLKYDRRLDDIDEAFSQSFEDHDDPTLKKSSPNSTPYRDDGAPPPPVHRNFGSKKAPALSPPVDQKTARLKRRTSSPLKHEYHPSDVSSEGSTSPISGSEDEDSVSDESSDDELEAVDIPDTTPAISIKKDIKIPTASIYSESSASIPPSLSTSREDVSKSEVKQPDYVIKSVASISYWDNKHGRWQDLWPDLCSIVTTPGLIEAYPYRRTHSSSGSAGQEDPPLIALDLTPLVMLRNSTVVDLEIRSPVLSYSRLYAKVVKYETSFFRFRVQSIPDCESLYMAVHQARMDNAKYKALEEETRVRAFGQYQSQEAEGDGNSQRRSWFGRKNSYRASARAPSQSAGSTSQSSGMSASSFLRKLMGGGNQSFNIAMSSVDRPTRFGSRDASLYTSSSSATPPRSPSVSAANSGSSKMSLTTNNLKVRLHLLISASKWEDHGNCFLEVTRPDRGTRQNLRKYQGMEKRIIVTTIPKKDSDKPAVVLDVILGSQCFSQLGSRGVLINVWEEVKDESGQTGVAPQGGGSGGNVRKWCFQCSSVAQARWIFGLVTQEVVIG
ncbi:uncharacterized protein F4807DRAFT_234531 [Annulohypoxylon truncatum]|uniref:uncharacterized protein n=1 Tax=Annulohypoxylon truncatum TaxID=327061 RepID=UPI00200739D6|nr:uncharacterized protein F4807DRAFT_234531 [Annulohypoxylon truncatum]KAI1206271.1 hypothetical protein F4807DRAFT_234531 [Annulohypoxylon truncatum]